MRSTDSVVPEDDFYLENKVIQSVLDAAFRVHRELGPGLLEGVYEAALFFELKEAGLSVQQQVPVSIKYKGIDLGPGFRADLIVENRLLLELKAVDELCEQHVSQVLTYLKLLNLKRGYLLNFDKKLMKDGIKRISL